MAQKAEAFAVARFKEHNEEEPFQLFQTYLLNAGITKDAPKGFKAKPITLPSYKTVQINTTVHAEGMDIEPGPMQTFTFRRDQSTDLLEFRLTPQETGHKQIRVEFYYQQHWLAQIKFEVEVVADKVGAPI